MTAAAYELPRWECLELLAANRIGRLCVVDGGFPIAVPVNYRLTSTDAVRIVVRTGQDTIVARATGRCSLEVDDIDLDHGRAWSVIVRATMGTGGAEELPDPEPLLANRTRWLTMDVTSISGRRFVLTPSADSFSVDWQTS